MGIYLLVFLAILNHSWGNETEIATGWSGEKTKSGLYSYQSNYYNLIAGIEFDADNRKLVLTITTFLANFPAPEYDLQMSYKFCMTKLYLNWIFFLCAFWIADSQPSYDCFMLKKTNFFPPIWADVDPRVSATDASRKTESSNYSPAIIQNLVSVKLVPRKIVSRMFIIPALRCSSRWCAILRVAMHINQLSNIFCNIFAANLQNDF